MTEHRSKIDYAHCIRWLVDQVYPQAEYVRIVQDNLNTHTAAALYEAFPAPEARRILQRVEFHYTPKHGSWLNMAESELGTLSSQCLDRRIPDKKSLIGEVAAWENSRNRNHTADASNVPVIALYNKPSETAVASPWNPDAKFMASPFALAKAGSAFSVRRR